VIHASVPALQPWMRATAFDFAPFVSTGLEWASKPPEVNDDDDRRPKGKKQRSGNRYVEEEDNSVPVQQVVRPAVPQAPKPQKPSEQPSTFVPIDAELA